MKIDEESKLMLQYISEDFVILTGSGGAVAYHVSSGDQINEKAFKIYCVKHYGDIVYRVPDKDGNEVEKRLGSGEVWWSWSTPERRVVRRIVMEPTCAAEDYNSEIFNRWYMLKQQMVEPDLSATMDSIEIFVKHLMYLADNNMVAVHYFLNWLAQLYQFPDSKIPTATLMYSKYGRVGKSKMYHLLKHVFAIPLVGTCNGSALQKAFDDAVEHKRIMFINEMARSDKEDGYERFKNMISEEVVTFEGKGRAAKEVANAVHYIITTNKADALPLMEGDGRVNVMRCTAARKDDAYYAELSAWIDGPGPALLAGVLAQWKFPKDWDYHAPVPQTEDSKAMQQESRGPLVMLLDELIEEQRPPFDKDVGRILDLTLQLEAMYGSVLKGARLNNRTLPMALERVGAVQLPVVNYTDKGWKKTTRCWCWRNLEVWNKATGEEVVSAMGIQQ